MKTEKEVRERLKTLAEIRAKTVTDGQKARIRAGINSLLCAACGDPREGAAHFKSVLHEPGTQIGKVKQTEFLAASSHYCLECADELVLDITWTAASALDYSTGGGYRVIWYAPSYEGEPDDDTAGPIGGRPAVDEWYFPYSPGK